MAKLPTWGGGHTTGSGVGPDGVRHDLTSGRHGGQDTDLISWVNDTLKKRGITSSNSGRAVDVEQKFAAIMDRDGLAHADLYINFPTGPCTVKLGCNQVLPALLGPNRSLTVHWPNGRHTCHGVG
ncbi:hypothetical protein OHT61_25385 [Streptomyces sp. NBC_00178]